MFITIDDGWTRVSTFPAQLRAAGIPVSLFLPVTAAEEGAAYFRELQSTGAVIEDHSLSHPDLRRLDFADQRRQVCDAATRLRSLFGRRPVLFRPPYGAYEAATRRAAAVCGMRALVEWDVSAVNGHLVFTFANGHLRPGDIILMHFTAKIGRDFAAATSAARAAGLTVRRLEDFL